MKRIYIVLVVLVFCFAYTQGFSQCWDPQTGMWTGFCDSDWNHNDDKNYWDEGSNYWNQCGCGDDYEECTKEAVAEYQADDSDLEIRLMYLDMAYDLCDFDWEDCADAC